MKTVEQMLNDGMMPEDIWDALGARPIPSEVDVPDFCRCIDALCRARAELHGSTDTEEGRASVLRAVAGSVAFGLYVGKLAERLSQTPSIMAMVKVGGGRNA